MERVEITSTSKYLACCPDICIRDGDQVQLIFRPEIVDNPSQPAAAVRGRFLYQRKGKNDAWEDFDSLPLSSLKKGEHFQLSLKAGELHHLLREIAPLYRLHKREGVPQGRLELLKVDQALSELLALTETELLAFLSAHSHDAVRTLSVVLKWFSKQALTHELIDAGLELPNLNALVGLANLRSVLGSWQANKDNKDEEFWQSLLASHSYVISQLFAYPVVLIKGKAYLGGKDLTNTGGNLVDFLFKSESSGAAVLIEIKTPRTSLLGAEYRSGVYPPSNDLSGGLSQVLEYRESLLTEFHALNRGDESLSAAEPYCLVIIGNAAKELDTDAKRRSFERFRERLVGVRVLTFDEVFRRIESLVSLLETAQ
jgi:hypothetical protein